MKKTINIFLSSTFRDMHAERDYIKKYVVPRLEEELYNYGITVHVTDLRWGVETTECDESEREEKVLNYCLDAIRTDRPYFVALIGGRYGWIPPKEKVEKALINIPENDRVLFQDTDDTSVTEMEILYGALGDEEMFDHSFFFFRKSNVYEQIPANSKGLFVESDSTAIAKLKALKKKIISSMGNIGEKDTNVFEYSAIWDNEKKTISGLEEFGNTLYKVLLDDIKKYNSDLIEISSESYEQQMIDAYVDHKLNGFIGRKDIVTFLTDFLNNFDPIKCPNINGYILTGVSGSGKSSVLSKVYDNIKQMNNPKHIILSVFAGITEDSVSIASTIQRWNELLEKKVGKSDCKHSIESFENLLIRAIAAEYLPIIIIDSYENINFGSDRFYPKTIREMKDLVFIPQNIPVVCTALPHYADTALKYNSSYQEIKLPNYTLEESREMVVKILGQRNKVITKSSTNSLLCKKMSDGKLSYTSPLWLRLALMILDEIDINSFNSIKESAGEREDVKIANYIENLISNFNGNPQILLKDLLEIGYRYFKKEIVQASMYFASISNYGVSINDLAIILDKEWNELEFTSFTKWMRTFLFRDSITDRWCISHNILRKAMAEDKELKSKYSSKYIDILFLNWKRNGKLNELLYQTIVQKDCEKFADILKESAWNGLEYKIFSLVHNNVSMNDITDLYCSFTEKYSMDCWQMEDLLNTIDFHNNSMDEKFSISPEEKLNLYHSILSHVNKKSVYTNDKWLFRNFAELTNMLLNTLDECDRTKAWEEEFEKFLHIFESNVKDYGVSFINSRSANIIHFLFTDYIHIIENINIKYNVSLIEGGEQRKNLCEEFTKRIIKAIQIDKILCDADLSEYGWLGLGIGVGLIKYHLSEVQKKSIKVEEESLGKLIEARCYTTQMKERTKQMNDETQEADDGIKTEVSNAYVSTNRMKEKKQNEIENNNDSVEEVSTFYGPENCLKSINSKSAYKVCDNKHTYKIIAYAYIRKADSLIAKGQKNEAFTQMKICEGIIVNFMRSKRLYAWYDNNVCCISNWEEEFKPLGAISYWYIRHGMIEFSKDVLERTFYRLLLQFSFSVTNNDGLKMLLSYHKRCCQKSRDLDEAIKMKNIDFDLLWYYPLPVGCHTSPKTYIYDDAFSDKISLWEQYRQSEEDFASYPYSCIRKYSDDYSAVAKNGHYQNTYIWGYIDRNGNEVIPPKFDVAVGFYEGLAMVGIGERQEYRTDWGCFGMRYGYIDRSGGVVIPIEYEYASSFFRGEALVAKNGEFFYIDHLGNKVRNYDNI